MKSIVVIVLLNVLLHAGSVSAQQQFIDYSKVSLLRWMGPGQPGTYAEYCAAHPPQPLQIVPVRMAPLHIHLDEHPPRVLVIVNSTLLPLIQPKLDRYISDIQAAGYAVDLYSSTQGTAEDLKVFILSQSTDLVGCVLFGDLPCAWYEIENDYEEYGYASFPCDLYLTDLDGTWGDLETTHPMQSGVYDIHYDGSGDTAPEIFLGRIDASQMDGDAEHTQINDYLDKLHAWYSLQLPMTNHALTYTEDDWSSFSEFETDIAYAFPDREAIKAPYTNRDDYRDNRLTSPVHQFIQLSCHSSSAAHYFTRGGELFNRNIKAIPPRALFYNLFCCSALRYTDSDFLGGAYIFNPSTTALATIGSTKTGSMLNFWAFYQPLGEGKTLGQAFSDWFNTMAPYSFTAICWFYGMTIVGDPLIVPVSSDPSNIVLIQPNGGEVFSVGEEYEIKWWTQSAKPDSINILLSVDSGDTYPYTVASGLPGTDTAYVWTVGDFPFSLSRIKVVAWYGGDVDGYDFSDSDFFIQGGPYRYVSKTGGNIFPYSAPTWAAHDIQDAIDAASAGDSIMVAAGTYTSALTILETPVYLLGGWNAAFTTNDPQANVTTIQSTGSVVTFINITSGSPGVEGFHITSGTGTLTYMPYLGTYGGGVFAYDSPAIIKNNVITGCGTATTTDFSSGGAIACWNAPATIAGNVISDCSAQSGGGIYLYQVTVAITGNTISGCRPNAEYTGTKNGGGIYARECNVTMAGNSISANMGYKAGGGLYARFSPLTMSGDSVYSNAVSMSGGGVCCFHSSLSMQHAYVADNVATTTGGGVYHRVGLFDMTNSLVAANTCGTMGGGVYADSCWGDWTNNTIDRNSSVDGGGNVFLKKAASAMDVRNNIVTYGNYNGFEFVSDLNVTYQYNNCYGNTPEDVATLLPDSTNSSRNPAYADTMTMDYYLGVHSGSIDAGDPAGNDPDGSVADQGVFGGPDAVMAALEYVKNISAAAAGAATIRVVWDKIAAPSLAYYAVYGDTAACFVPEEALMLAAVPAGTEQFDHTPVEGCWSYVVSAVNTSGYGGGYSVLASACADNATGEEGLMPRYVDRLEQNYPNPFNGTTTIVYSVAGRGEVNIRIYDTAGRLTKVLEQKTKDPGRYETVWRGDDGAGRAVASGIYFCRITTGSFSQTRKIVYLR